MAETQSGDDNSPSIIYSRQAVPPSSTEERNESNPSWSDWTGSTIMLSPRSFDVSSSSSTEVPVVKDRRLILIRNAERVDHVFTDWMKGAFVTGEYHPYDLNLPLRLPKRVGSPHVFAGDCPLTEMGNSMAQMVGRGLDGRRVLVLISSPALRCMQTSKAASIEMANAADFDQPIPICMEPALCDYVAQYPALPCWMTDAEFAQEDYPINSFYKPIYDDVSCQELEQETMKECRDRYQVAVTHLLRCYPGAGDVVLVTHGIAIHWLVRGLVHMRPTGKTLDETYPHASVVILEHSDAGNNWRLCENAIHPITCADYTNRTSLTGN